MTTGVRPYWSCSSRESGSGRGAQTAAGICVEDPKRCASRGKKDKEGKERNVSSRSSCKPVVPAIVSLVRSSSSYVRTESVRHRWCEPRARESSRHGQRLAATTTPPCPPRRASLCDPYMSAASASVPLPAKARASSPSQRATRLVELAIVVAVQVVIWCAPPTRDR
jgi:hypothetical protein